MAPPPRLGRLGDGLGIGVRDAFRVNVAHGFVVVEVAVAPVTTLEADAGVAVAIVDTAVKPNMKSPIAGTPEVDPIGPRPIAWGPQRAAERRQPPHAGHPEVSQRSVSPVARRPQIA